AAMSQQVASIAGAGFECPAMPEAQAAAPAGRPDDPASADAGDQARRLQIVMSPYHGEPDFSVLTDDYLARAQVDMVSIADLLRNGFVYAPHSTYRGVKLATPGFDPLHDMHDSPEYRYQFRDSGRSKGGGDAA